MKIINNTNLNYSTIGQIIDSVLSIGKTDTHYYGQVECATVEVKKQIIKLQIRYLKKYTEWRFDEK